MKSLQFNTSDFRNKLTHDCTNADYLLSVSNSCHTTTQQMKVGIYPHPIFLVRNKEVSQQGNEFIYQYVILWDPGKEQLFLLHGGTPIPAQFAYEPETNSHYCIL